LLGPKAHPEHFDLSRHPRQTFSLSRIFGRYSKTNSIPFVIGTPSAHEIRLKVQDDFKDNSGVYAIGESPPYPRTYAIHSAPVNPTTIGPMNCLNGARYLMLNNIPINVMIPQKISNSIDITSLRDKKTIHRCWQMACV
jgi:hypothetical protein